MTQLRPRCVTTYDMDTLLGMVGTTFRRAGQAELQRFTLDVSEQPQHLATLHAACGFTESVYLATCNRVEIMFACPRDVSVAECRRRIYRFFHPIAAELSPQEQSEEMRAAARMFHAYESDGAAEHLFMVAAALDSMNPGEAQILGQVKGAYRQASEMGLTGAHLQVVFEEAFSAAKKVRHDTRLGSGTVSMLSLALHLIETRIQGPAKRLVVVGVGDMAHQCGALYRDRPGLEVLFVNRTLGRAEALVEKYGGKSMALSTFLDTPPPFDVLVSATAAPQPMFGTAFFSRVKSAPLVVDLALQRDVEPAAAAGHGAELFDIDRLRDLAQVNRRVRTSELADARALLDDALGAFRRRLIEREMAPVVRLLRQHFQSTLEVDLEHLFARILPHADASQQAEIRQWAQTLVNRLAHVPTVGLKKIAVEHGARVVDGFLAAAQDEADSVKGT